MTSTSPAVPRDLTGGALQVEAVEALARLVGNPDAQFHPGQYEAIEQLVAGRSRVLVVQRTGWGKSAVYFVATALQRARGTGPTLIISPLLALMRDQIAAAARAGVTAVTMNTGNAHEWGAVRAALAADTVDVLLVSPERLNNPRFRDEQLPDLAARCGLLVVDEAHCISDWGHDFRPDYRRIRDILVTLPPGTPVLATTATANARVVADVVDQLGATASGARPQVHTLRGGLARDSLRLGVLPSLTGAQRLAWLISHLDTLPGSGIIYTLTVAGAHDVAAALTDAGISVAAYTGRTDPAEREQLEEALRSNSVKALVATSALGMGFDKPDLGFVVHLGAPNSPVAYYQQVGRAGRATDRADVLLLPGVEDREIWAYFASVSMPRQDQALAVLAALGSAGGVLSTAAIEALVDIGRTRLEVLLKVLDVEGAVTKVAGGWQATGASWTYDAQRYARVAAARVAEQELMLAFEGTTECRMAFLQAALDDPEISPCGRCDTCTKPWYPTHLAPEVISASAQRLDRPGVRIEPRSQWPSGMVRLGIDVKGRLPVGEVMAAGYALGRFSDLGWGPRLRTLLAHDGPVPAEVVAAVVEVLSGWGWSQRPTAVVGMPSRQHPQLVTSLGQAIAQIGRIPWLGPLAAVQASGDGEQFVSSDPATNSAFRLAQVWGRWHIPEGVVGHLGRNAGPILLVDDIVGSRWSLTVAARALRLAGASEVLPLTLAAQG